jgi:hypothetical protein
MIKSGRIGVYLETFPELAGLVQMSQAIGSREAMTFKQNWNHPIIR